MERRRDNYLGKEAFKKKDHKASLVLVKRLGAVKKRRKRKGRRKKEREEEQRKEREKRKKEKSRIRGVEPRATEASPTFGDVEMRVSDVTATPYPMVFLGGM